MGWNTTLANTSLGVALYECLTLQHPFSQGADGGIGPLYHAIMTRSPEDPCKLNPRLPREIRVVISKAMEKNRDDRFRTAVELANDLRRIRRHEPILTVPPSPIVRLRRWAQRNPLLAMAAGLICLLGGTVFGLVAERQRVAERDRLNNERNTLREQRLYALKSDKLVADASGAEDPALALRLLSESIDSRQALSGSGASSADRIRTAVAVGVATKIITRLQGRTYLVGHSAGVIDAAFSPDGRFVITLSGGTARAWDAETGAMLGKLDHPGIKSFGWHEGRPVAVIAFDDDLRLSAIENGGGRFLHSLPAKGVTNAWLSHGGTLLLTTGTDGAHVWKTASARLLRRLGDKALPLLSAAFDPGDLHVITVDEDGTVRLWDAGNEAAQPKIVTKKSADFDPTHAALGSDGRVAIVGSNQRGPGAQLRLEIGLVARPPRHLANLASATFIPGSSEMLLLYDGQAVIASAGPDEEKDWIRGWIRLEGHSARVTSATSSPDGRRIVTTSADGTAIVWDRQRLIRPWPKRDLGLPGLKGPQNTKEDAHGPPLIYSPRADRIVAVPHHTTGEQDYSEILAISADGTELIQNVRSKEHDAAREPRTDTITEIVDTNTRTRSALLPGDSAETATFSNDARYCAVRYPTNSVAWRRDGTRTSIPTIPDTKAIACSSRAPHLLTITTAGVVTIWNLDATDGSPIPLANADDRFETAGFSPDGRFVWMRRSTPQGIRITNIAGDRPVTVIETPLGELDPAFSSDGSTVAAVAEDRTVRVWRTATGNMIDTPFRYNGKVTYVALSSAGNAVATLVDDGTMRIDQIAPRNTISIRLLEEQQTSFARFCVDDRFIVTAAERRVAIWSTRTGIESWAEGTTLYGFSVDNDWISVKTEGCDQDFRHIPIDPLGQLGHIGSRCRDFTLDECDHFDIGKASERGVMRALLDELGDRPVDDAEVESLLDARGVSGTLRRVALFEAKRRALLKR